LLAAVCAAGCQKPHYDPEPTVQEGRLEELMESRATSETRRADRPDRSQELADLNAELRARHAAQLDEMLKRIEQSYLKDKDGWMNYEPIREEQVRTIWDTKPEKVP
jgi:hypothetical protein